MNDPLAHWLQLREPTDTAARSSALTTALLPALTTTVAAGTLRVLDLGTGTGANVRYLAPRLPGRQEWLTVDRNPALLALLPARISVSPAANGGEPRHCDIETRIVDFGTLDDESLFAGRHLVTASALLDLTSEWWLATLAARCREAGAAALFALSYDGSFTCSPAEPEDDIVRDFLNQHQRRDKGLGGTAAGPDAAACAMRCFADAGYHVRAEPSRWTLGSSQEELQRHLVDGWRQAAIELMPGAADTIECWHTRRQAHIDRHRSQIAVGHVDIAAWPAD